MKSHIVTILMSLASFVFFMYWFNSAHHLNVKFKSRADIEAEEAYMACVTIVKDSDAFDNGDPLYIACQDYKLGYELRSAK